MKPDRNKKKRSRAGKGKEGKREKDTSSATGRVAVNGLVKV